MDTLIDMAMRMYAVAVRPTKDALDACRNKQTVRDFLRASKTAQKEFERTRDALLGANRFSGRGLQS